MKKKTKKIRRKKIVKKSNNFPGILIGSLALIIFSSLSISLPSNALSKKFSEAKKTSKQETIMERPKKNLSDINGLGITEFLVAEETNGSKLIINGEEKVIPNPTEKNITYMQILQNPNDLDLNLKYARQQGKQGNYKQTIATLERLGMLYPDNVEIRLYLLSVLVQADSPDKALTIIGEIKESEDLSEDDLLTVNEIEEEIKSRKGPKLWNFYADIGIGAIQSNNVNSVSRTR